MSKIFIYIQNNSLVEMEERMNIAQNNAKGNPPPQKKKWKYFLLGRGEVKVKRTQASKPLAKALRALAKALSKSSARNTSLSEP